MHSKKRLFLVGIAPDLTKRAVLRAKQMNYEVIVGETPTEMQKNRALVEAADQVIEVNINDFNALYSVAEQLHHEKKIDGMYTFREFSSEPTAKVIEKLGLYGLPFDVVEACNDKFKTKANFEKQGVLSAKYQLCSTLEEVEDFFKSIAAPIIIKPLKMQGSLGVFKITKEEEIHLFFERCKTEGNDGVVLAEEFIEGQEISLEVVVCNGKVYVLGVTEKLLFPGTFVERGHTTAYESEVLDAEDFQNIAENIVKAASVFFGAMFIEGFVTPKGFYCGEIHTRYGGDQISTITELGNKYDLITPIFSELMGEVVEVVPVGEREISGARFISAKPGKIVEIEGVEAIKRMDGVHSIDLYCQVGNVVNELCWNRDRLGCVVAKAPSREALESIFNDVFNVLRIETV
ncbi:MULTISPECIES: ATP-grasp domain-containing protein [unclassified Paenibacillus]|uniref:ATP-grasp domain-containing protein n=1 Tax=unclassified Paenibacillus TaxID=185978 RepID=UPI000FA5AC40|nr:MULTISPECIES: ATP-grasp domain-containing protein [unclassified Paenibacillus]MBP1172905.1 biotin carboxylase [Paenibacillus sp. PvR133]MBP1310366.1 biotin carboxylase [Paenibacillus sp. 1182]